jgi:hypothetical protein
MCFMNSCSSGTFFLTSSCMKIVRMNSIGNGQRHIATRCPRPIMLSSQDGRTCLVPRTPERRISASFSIGLHSWINVGPLPDCSITGLLFLMFVASAISNPRPWTTCTYIVSSVVKCASMFFTTHNVCRPGRMEVPSTGQPGGRG